MLNNLTSQTGGYNNNNIKAACLQEQIDQLDKCINEAEQDIAGICSCIGGINSRIDGMATQQTVCRLESCSIKTGDIDTKCIKGSPGIDSFTAKNAAIDNLTATKINSTEITSASIGAADIKTLASVSLSAETAEIGKLTIKCPVNISGIGNNLDVNGKLTADNIETGSVKAPDICSCSLKVADTVSTNITATNINTASVKAGNVNTDTVVSGKTEVAAITGNGSITNTYDNAYLIVKPFSGVLMLKTCKYDAVIKGTGSIYDIQFTQEGSCYLNDLTINEGRCLILHIEDPENIGYTYHTSEPVEYCLETLYNYSDKDCTIDVCGALWKEHNVILNRDCYGSGMCVKGLLKADRIWTDTIQNDEIITKRLTVYDKTVLGQDNTAGDLSVCRLKIPYGDDTSEKLSSGNITQEVSDDTKTVLSHTTAESLCVNKESNTNGITNKGHIDNTGDISNTGNISNDGDISNTGHITAEADVNTPIVHTDSIQKLTNDKLDIGHKTTTLNDLVVNGDIIQKGQGYETHAEDLYVKDSCIKLRDGAVSGLADGEYSGISVMKYDGVNNINVVVGCDGTARLGKETSLQPFALRNEENKMTDGALVEWDAANKRLNTTTFKADTTSCLDTITACTTCLQTQITGNDNDIATLNTCVACIKTCPGLNCVGNVKASIFGKFANWDCFKNAVRQCGHTQGSFFVCADNMWYGYEYIPLGGNENVCYGRLNYWNSGAGLVYTCNLVNGTWYSTKFDGPAASYPISIKNGGTGVTSQADINKAFIDNLDIASSNVTDGTEFVSSWASDNGFSEPGAVNKPYKRKFSRVWNYIQEKIGSVLGLTASSYGGTACQANKIVDASRSWTPTEVSEWFHNCVTAVCNLSYTSGTSKIKTLAACVYNHTCNYSTGYVDAIGSERFIYCKKNNIVELEKYCPSYNNCYQYYKLKFTGCDVNFIKRCFAYKVNRGSATAEYDGEDQGAGDGWGNLYGRGTIRWGYYIMQCDLYNLANHVVCAPSDYNACYKAQFTRCDCKRHLQYSSANCLWINSNCMFVTDLDYVHSGCIGHAYAENSRMGGYIEVFGIQPQSSYYTENVINN